MISANNVTTFKTHYQELIFDYKSTTLTGTGNRSYVDSFDVNTFSFSISLFDLHRVTSDDVKTQGHGYCRTFNSDFYSESD